MARPVGPLPACRPKRQLDDPWCLGYFVDNKIKWGDTQYLASCTIMAPATQKAKIAMVDWLKGRYQDTSETQRGMEDIILLVGRSA